LNINQINFNNDIENYIPCGRSLYVTRPLMRKVLYKSIVKNNNLLKKLIIIIISQNKNMILNILKFMP